MDRVEYRAHREAVHGEVVERDDSNAVGVGGLVGGGVCAGDGHVQKAPANGSVTAT